MDCNEFCVNVRKTSPEERKEGQRQTQLLFQINHTMPLTEKYNHLIRDLFGNNLGEGSRITPPLNGACIRSMKIGKNVLINSNLLAMARGGIVIEDNAMIAANVQIITNNHDPYDLWILPCKQVLIKEYAWIGAGATVLPGVCIGRHKYQYVKYYTVFQELFCRTLGNTTTYKHQVAHWWCQRT